VNRLLSGPAEPSGERGGNSPSYTKSHKLSGPVYKEGKKVSGETGTPPRCTVLKPRSQWQRRTAENPYLRIVNGHDGACEKRDSKGEKRSPGGKKAA